MDTLATGAPQIGGTFQTQQRTEALERLMYLAQTGACGLLSGASGTGKTWLLAELARSLRRDGLSVAQMNLTGVTGPELPYLVAMRLGLGQSTTVSPIELWILLQEYAEAALRTRARMCFLLDHVERSDLSIIRPLSRLMDEFRGACSWIAAARSPAAGPVEQFFRERSWLRVELAPLDRRQSEELLARDLSEQSKGAEINATGLDAGCDAAMGKIRRLRQLAELASLGVLVDQPREIDREFIREIVEEMIP